MYGIVILTETAKNHVLSEKCADGFLPGIDGTGLSTEPLMKLAASDVAVTIVRYLIDKLLSLKKLSKARQSNFSLELNRYCSKLTFIGCAIFQPQFQDFQHITDKMEFYCLLYIDRNILHVLAVPVG
jgi:hypothetical protein